VSFRQPHLRHSDLREAEGVNTLIAQSTTRNDPRPWAYTISKAAAAAISQAPMPHPPMAHEPIIRSRSTALTVPPPGVTHARGGSRRESRPP
jgi:hypothetical protein